MSAINFDREKARRIDREIDRLRGRMVVLRARRSSDPEVISDIAAIDDQVAHLEGQKRGERA